MMAPGGINIERVEIENIFIFPGAAPEGDFSGIFNFINDQLKAGADPKIMHDDGYPVDQEATVEPEDTQSPEKVASDDAIAEEAEELEARFVEGKVKDRAKLLRRVAKHVTEARHVQGLQKQPGHTPERLEAFDERYDDEMETATLALKKACELCDFRKDCKLTGNAELWTDAHPYKDDRTGKRRAKTSPKIKAVEPRTGFLKLLDDGVAANEQIHCDPAKRK